MPLLKFQWSPLDTHSCMSIRILVIDDEESVCEILKYNLEKEGYEVDTAYSAEEALEMDLGVYDLFMVDIMMDQLSGYDFAREIRKQPQTEQTPVLFCSALTDEDAVVKGLNIGADDYVTKPFVIGEVLARIRAILRRSSHTVERHPASSTPPASIYEPDIVFETLRIDRNDKECCIGDKLSLTRTEFDILLFLLTHPNRIYSRGELIKAIWPGDTVVSQRTIDTNITRLRKKLGNYEKNIVTRAGFGYGFKEKN